jgi:hypothetical protein
MPDKSDQTDFLNEIAAALSIKPRSLSKRLGVDRAQVCRWRKNGFHPSTERLIRALMGAEQPVDAEDLGVINGPIHGPVPKEREKPQRISIDPGKKETDKPRKVRKKKQRKAKGCADIAKVPF